MSELDDLYQEVLLEHAKSVSRRYKPAGPCSCAQGFNPLCGDEVAFYCAREGRLVREASFEGQGCAISQASASMAAQAAQGLSTEEALAELECALAWVKGESSQEPKMEDWAALGGVSKFPMRVKCATMPIRAALESLKSPQGAVVEVGDES